MCNNYPNCQHAGPLVDKVAGIDRHCETVLPNHDCPYLMMGCFGCTFRRDGAAIEIQQHRNRVLYANQGIIVPVIPAVDWSSWATDVNNARSFEINLEMKIDETALLALLAGCFRTYSLLQGLVSAGIVSKQWADRSLQNVIQYTYRQAICRLVAAYILTRSNPDD